MPRGRAGEEQIEDALGGARVKRAGRLVGQQQARFVGQRARHRDPLALAAGELARQVVGAVGQADLVEQRERAAATLGVVHAGADQRDFDVRPGGQRLQQQMALEDEAHDLAAGAHGMALLPDGAPVDQDAARVGLLEAADQAQQRALARARAAGDRDRFAGRDLQRDAREGLTAPKCLATSSTPTAAPAGSLIE